MTQSARLLAWLFSAVWSAAAFGQSPVIEVLSVPPYGSRPATISGRISGVNPNEVRVAPLIFISGLGYYSKPFCSTTTVPVDPDGSFQALLTTGGVDQTAQVIALLLVSADLTVPCVVEAPGIPEDLEAAALAKLILHRPDPNRRSIRFAGETWFVKAADAPVGPGPNRFSDAESQVFVDAGGSLHLRHAREDGEWRSAEVYSAERVGYGTYRFSFEIPDGLHPCQIFGAFTWADAERESRELDAIEVGRFCDPSRAESSQVVVQPFTSLGNLKRFDLPVGVVVTQEMDWTREGVSFRSFVGDVLVHSFGYQGDAIPSPDSENLRFRFNFWWFDPTTSDREEAEFIVHDFRYEPLEPVPPSVSSVANGASFETSGLAPCSLFSIFGTSLAAEPQGATSTPLPTSLGDTKALFDGVAVPLLYVSESQINGQVPCDLAPGSSLLVVETPFGATMATVVAIEANALGIFQMGDACIATDQSWQLVTNERPAPPGGVVSLFLTGLGVLDPPIPTGEAAPIAPLSRAREPFEASFDGVPAGILFLGAAPGLVIGQANVRLAGSLATGRLVFRLRPVNGGEGASCLLPVGAEPLPLAPVVREVSPSSADRGFATTILGTNFRDGAEVLFGAALAPSVTVVDSTEISAVVPAGSGTVDVIVLNPDGQEGVRSNAFTYPAPAVCGGEPTNETIEYGELAVCTIDSSGDTDAFRFHAAAGERFWLAMSRQTGGALPCMELFSPTGDSLIRACGRFGGNIVPNTGWAEISREAAETGVYTVLTSAFRFSAPMDYALALHRLSPPTPGAPALVVGATLAPQRIDPVGEADLYVVPSSINDTVISRVTKTQGGGFPEIRLIGPDGDILASAAGRFGGNIVPNVNHAEVRFTLQRAGPHALLVLVAGHNQTIEYSVDFQCIGACTEQ